jgi:hypothetical protein
MAAISISNCTVTSESSVIGNLFKIVTPDTADDGDTIDCSTYFKGDDVIHASCQAATDGWLPVAEISTAGNLTIPGSTENEARTIYVMCKYGQ